MESSVTEQDQVPESPIEAPPEEEMADRTSGKLFRFSEFVHVGPGADECEHRLDGKCADAEHFHAWCRLPNKFQIATIREKAQAARARVIRQAKDPETDRFEILENQMAELRDQGHQAMVDELLGRNAFKMQHRAMRELAEEEDSPFATIEEDQKRWQYLTELEEADRPADEYGELLRHLEQWNDAVEVKYEELIQPERDSLTDRDEDELMEMVRDIAIREQADGIFMRVFSKYQWAICTLKPRGEGKVPTEKVYGSLAELENAAPEVVAELEACFGDLETELNERQALRAEGN